MVTKVAIPKILLEEFRQYPRVVIPGAWPGLWPVPVEIYKNPEFFAKLAASKEFNAKYDIIIVPKVQGAIR